MASRFKLAMALAGAISIGSHAWAADPPGAEPAQPLDERITNGPDDTLDPLGPAQPEGLAPSATRPESEPEECRGLPRDARAACLENSNRGAEEPPVPQVPATPAEKASPASRPSGGTLKR